ncbi:MAG: adenosylcobinamide-GDP ribazoletransferase [Oscillospiraceae bacterium]|nr:adenosylcobinamide-GDP ribazoletransferase [Oscillospiraceae bacterium]
MWAFETVIAAFSMFSALPMPQVDWNGRNMRYMLCAFPLVGVLTGGACWLWSLLAEWLALPAVLTGAGLCLLPILVTGGVHLDGYCDTSDALASHAPPEKKQEILKDSHLGAFAAIRLGCWLAADFALWVALPEFRGGPILLSFCLSRAMSGLAMTAFPLARSSGLAHTFSKAADRGRARSFLLALSLLLTATMVIFGWIGAAMAAAAWLVFARYYAVAKKQFGGLSGDLAGWFLQRAELGMLLALCLMEYLLEAMA